MLSIRADQQALFERLAADAYLREVAAHCRAFAPELCTTLDDSQLQEAVRIGIARARTRGLDQRGPVQFYIDMMILFGAGFDEDPQYPWIAPILAEAGSQLQRTEDLHLRTKVYLEKAHGEKNRYMHEAMQELSRLLRFGMPLSQDGFEDEVLALMREIHPRKVAQIDEASLRRLISHARTTGTERYGFRDLRSHALWATLMFAFGHEFETDPFLPWLVRPFRAEHALSEPDRTAQRIERRALVWLEVVLRHAGAGSVGLGPT
jgi:hypothetical protein